MPAHLITPPALEPITLQEAKDHLRLDHAFDDAQVSGAILGARMYVEEICWRGLVTQTWELVEPHFPSHNCGCGIPWGLEYGLLGNYSTNQRIRQEAQGFELPKGNLGTVTSVKYLEPVAGVVTTLSAAEYLVDTASTPGRVRLAFEKAWPDHRAQWDAVRIQYTVGWAVADVPRPIKQALLLLVGHLYENRLPEAPGRLTPVQFAVDSLLAPYRLVRHT